MGLKVNAEKQLNVRLDLAIVDGYNVFQWVSTGDEKFSTSTFNPILQSEPEGEDSAFTYVNGFNNHFLRSTFIDLNDEVMNGLSNASLVINVVSLNDAAPAAPAAKPAKGAPPVEVKPAEESLFKFKIPLHALLTAKNCTMSLFQPISELVQQAPFNATGAVELHSNILDSKTALSIKISADNDFAEYVLGSKILQWEGALLAAPPAAWGLHAIDVIDPKAKVPATETELRAKYLENIAKLVNDQANTVTFDLSIGLGKDQPVESAAEDPDAPDAVSSTTARIQSMFPYNALSKGKIAFNAELAATVPANEDIRARGDLWSCKWCLGLYLVLVSSLYLLYHSFLCCSDVESVSCAVHAPQDRARVHHASSARPHCRLFTRVDQEDSQCCHYGRGGRRADCHRQAGHPAHHQYRHHPRRPSCRAGRSRI